MFGARVLRPEAQRVPGIHLLAFIRFYIIVISFLEVTAKGSSFTHIQTSVTHAENMSFLINAPFSGVV